jgi:hypothetical protein
MRTFVFLLGCAVLGGCQTTAQTVLTPQEQLQNAKDDETCRSWGNSRGTYDYNQCRTAQLTARR